MRVEDVKWYSPFLFLLGAILSFADPITDILILVEFYRADHKTWFGVGLAFVLLPCLVFALLNIDYRKKRGTNKCTQYFLCGFHPFSAAFARLEGFVFSLRFYINNKVTIVPEDVSSASVAVLSQLVYTGYLRQQGKVLLVYIEFLVVFEAVLESVPQFIIQLYAVCVQEEPVEIIQMISLPVSFLSIAWSVTTVDEMLYNDVIGSLKLKLKLALFLQNLFLMTSTIFAYCFFIVSYKWWVISFPLINFLMAVILTCLQRYIRFPSINLSCLYFGRGSEAQSDDSGDAANWINAQRMMYLIHLCLFVLENLVMILSFCFGPHSNNWYSLPVTVCVCLFSVLWCVMRVIVFHFLYNERNNNERSDNTVNP